MAAALRLADGQLRGVGQFAANCGLMHEIAVAARANVECGGHAAASERAAMPRGCRGMAATQTKQRRHSRRTPGRVVRSGAMQNQLFINGEFVDARSNETFATINPATEETITNVASAGAEDVDAAVKTARAQMEPGSGGQKMKPRDRAKGPLRIARNLPPKEKQNRPNPPPHNR